MDFRESKHLALTRQYDSLTRQQGAAFILQLREWWRQLTSDPIMNELISESVSEASELFDRFRKHEQATVAELVALKDQMVKAHSAMDDSTAPEPDEWNNPGSAKAHKRTLAHFGKVAEAARGDGPVRFSIRGKGDASASNELIGILDHKLDKARHVRSNANGTVENVKENLAPELDFAMVELTDVRGRHARFFETLTLDKLVSPGVAASWIKQVVDDLVPAPTRVRSQADLVAMVDAALDEQVRELKGAVSVTELREALLSERSDTKDDRVLNQWETDLRPHVERLYEDLRTRLDSRRSLLGLLRRFKARCEWHDRARLRAIGRNGNEDSLTAELARWLFDQGLTPITKPLVGGLEPDLLEPGSIYVEAKQYKKDNRPHLRKGMYQLAGTVATLRGTPHDVREAFFVVFRQGGPQYVFPERLTIDGLEIFPVLIDIAPTTESGSRARYQPQAFTEAELGAAYRGKGLR